MLESVYRPRVPHRNVFPKTIKEIQAIGQVTTRTTADLCVQACVASCSPVDLGPNTRKTNATANGTSPNKTMSPSLNSGKRARMTNKPSTIQ